MTKQKKMGFASIYLLGVNGIIGSGIFLLPNQIFSLAGNKSSLVIILAAIATLMIALCYADLASRFTGDGAAWLYTYNAFGRFPGFQVGFFSWIQGVITISAEIAALLSILKPIFPSLTNLWEYRLVGIVIIIVLAILSLLGEQVTKISDNLSSIVKIVILLAFIVIGFIGLSSKQTIIATTSKSPYEMSSAFSKAFYMFTGFSFLPIAAADMKDPEKNLPKALIWVIVTVGVIYALAQTIAVLSLGNQITKTDSPLAAVFQQILGHQGYLIILVGMAVSIIGVALSVSFSTPVVAASLSNEHKLLPSFIGKQSKGDVPWVAVIITTVLSGLVFLSGSYVFLVSCVVLISLIQYVPTALAVIHFQSQPSDGWNLPGGKIIPGIAIGMCAYLLAGVALKVWLFTGILVVLGLGLYLFDDHSEKKAKD
ncbi:APC family permease [Lentilactobacillus sp. Marseille-Q4993]|uniref:APC family permease n=1 Tax=Lentilactobacillus sp. Marseille-Q4993 TaxID=3039492 RepID=UPI0024BD365C|nr:APC family permease [Lentilactobacillus sp. Marseille-Q4993]